MIDMIHKYKAAWVVYNHNISYVRPARVGEWVRIMSRLLWYNHNTVILEYYMTDDTKKELKTVLWTTMRYVTIKEGKSTDHSGAVLDFLKATSENLDIASMTITDRVKSLKQKLLEA